MIVSLIPLVFLVSTTRAFIDWGNMIPPMFFGTHPLFPGGAPHSTAMVKPLPTVQIQETIDQNGDLSVGELEFVNGQLQQYRQQSVGDSCDRNWEASCSSTDSLLICSGATNTESGILMNVACPTDAPTCRNGKCLLRNPVSVSSTPATITCPSIDGYYPDTNSCSRYYYCSNGVATTFTCSWPQTYDPILYSCRLGAFCYRFRCLWGRNYGPYLGDPNIYATCSSGRPTSLNRCETGLGLDVSTQTCQPYCLTEGLRAINQSSCSSSYFTCSRSLLGVRIATQTCPPGFYFDNNLNFCVPGTCPTSISDATSSTTQSSTITTSSTTESATSEITTTETEASSEGRSPR